MNPASEARPSGTRPSETPRLVFCDEDGLLYDHPELEAVGVDGPEPETVPAERWIPVPEGSDLFVLPGRLPLARDPESGEIVELEGAQAASVFLAPAWTRDHLPAYQTLEGAPRLPLHAHSVLGFADEAFWTAAVRVDPDTRQDPWLFDLEDVRRDTHARLETLGENRVAQQLSRCALDYECRAAQNYFLGRHEAPLPTSVACNAQCIGCISLQPDGEFRASHERLTRRVEPGEIAEVALDHWSRVPDGVVSFGQGCEGEPLLEAEVLVEAVRMLREQTAQGTINLNSNASRPEAVAELADAGLDTMRVSLNSARPDVHAGYYQPRGWGVDELAQSVIALKERGGRVSTNLLYFPGVTDTEPELEAFADFVVRTGVDLVQMRNLNIDPELYAECLPEGTQRAGFGVAEFMRRLSERAPHVRYGYFNLKKEQYG